jgi:hypothetical protein
MNIMFTRQDGTLAIVHGAPKAHIERSQGRAITNEEYRTMVWGTVPADAINAREVEPGGIPATREFRNAWRDTSPEAVVDIDLAAAKEVKLVQIRLERVKLLEKADANVEKAKDVGDVAAEAAARAARQALRDVTNPLKQATITDIAELEGKTLADYLGE